MPCKVNLRAYIWDSTMNETEENKDLAWKRIGDSCGACERRDDILSSGLPNGELQHVHYQPRSIALH